MKITVGLDHLESAKGLADLLSDLRFAAPDVELVHVLERLGQESVRPPEGVRPDAINNFLRMQEEEADRLLQDGAAALERRGLTCKTVRLMGFSGNRIVDHAAETKTDLLALGSSGKGTVESVVLGSVGRKALVSATCSVLLAKDYRTAKSGMTAVIATDHSPYAKRCLDKFLAWRPQGIARAIVVTVYPEQLLGAMSAVMANFKADVAGWVRTELERENAGAVGKLASLGIACTARVEKGAVSDTLERVMKEERADVLVLGAQGHGFLDRLLIGSVSLDQALRRPYPVLVVRS